MKIGDIVVYTDYNVKIQIIGRDKYDTYMIKLTPPLGVSINVDTSADLLKKYNVKKKYIQSKTINVYTGVSLSSLKKLCKWCYDK